MTGLKRNGGWVLGQARRIHGLLLGRAFWMLLASLWPAVRVRGAEGDAGVPRLCVVAPVAITAGTNALLKLRGLGLTNVTQVSIRPADSSLPTITAKIGEKKPIDVPSGLEAKDIGDSLVTVEVQVPASLSGQEVMIRVLSADGTTATRAIRVVERGVFGDEKEPNNGFRDAQPLSPGKGVVGAIGSERDVDVFAIAGRAGHALMAEITAARIGSLLDGVLTLYDAKGRVLISSDDRGGSRDPNVRFKPAADGTYYLAVQDASDRGTPWHGYELNLREEP